MAEIMGLKQSLVESSCLLSYILCNLHPSSGLHLYEQPKLYKLFWKMTHEAKNQLLIVSFSLIFFLVVKSEQSVTRQMEVWKWKMFAKLNILN